MAKNLSTDEHSIVFDNTDPAVQPGVTNADDGGTIVFNSDSAQSGGSGTTAGGNAGTAVQGADGQSSSSTGESQTSNQSETQTSNNGVPVTGPGTITTPGTTTSSEGTATPGADGQSSSTPGTSTESNTYYQDISSSNNQTPAPAPVSNTGADGADVSTGQNVSNQSGDSSVSSAPAVGADGQSSSSTGESVSNTQTDTQVYENGVPVSGSSSSPNSGTSGTESPVPDAADVPTYGGFTPPEGTVTATGTTGGQSATDHVNISDGQVDIVKGSVSIKTGLDGSATIRNGDLNITTSPDGSALVQAGGVNIDTNNMASGFPTSSTYLSSQTAAQTGGSQSATPQSGWGSTDTTPPDPVSGILGSTKTRFSNPLQSKTPDIDDSL